MKLLRVRITRGGTGDPAMRYPARYNAQEVDRNGMYATAIAGTTALSGGLSRGEDVEFCVIALRDELADEYALDPDMELITPEMADQLIEQWRVLRGDSEEVVDSPSRIQAIAVKQQAGLPLTDEDRAALDPASAVPGVRRRVRPVREVLGESLSDYALA